MVKFNSDSRLFSIKPKVILTQTDTTVGFLSQNEGRLKEIKSRDSSKPFIVVHKNFKSLLSSGIRIPHKQKRVLRRSKKTTFIIKNLAFRVSKDSLHSSVLRAVTWNYSTSANEAGKNFSLAFCEEKADIIVQNKIGLFQGDSSSLYKINNSKREKLR